MLQTQIKTITVNEHPIRHFAHNNHKTIIEHENAITGNIEPCRELFYYYNSIEYNSINNSYGYCAISVCTDYKNSFIVELEAEYPDHLRKQHHKHFTYNKYQEARQKALQLIDYAEKWLRSDWWKDLPMVFVDKKTWNEHKQHMKKIMHDGAMVVRLVSDASKLRFNVDLDKYKHNEYFKVKLVQFL